MYFQRLEDLRIDADKTQQEIADLLYTAVMRRVSTRSRSGR